MYTEWYQKVVKVKKPGSLGKGFFSKSVTQQKRTLGKIAKSEGERVAAGKMRAVQVLTKRTNPSVSKKAKKLASWVYENYWKEEKIKNEIS